MFADNNISIKIQTIISDTEWITPFDNWFYCNSLGQEIYNQYISD